MPESGSNVDRLVDHLFRHQAGQMTSTLTRIFGPANLDLAEDVVQEALLEALHRWPFGGVPNNPRAWLLRVARNRAIDVIRRNSRFRSKAQEIESMLEHQLRDRSNGHDMVFDNEINDDQLRMAFTCCHSAIPREARVALTLKTVGGFGVSEIARAFLTKETTIAQRLVRAKRKIKEQRLPFEMPDEPEMSQRLTSVLEALYLMFNEGYSAHEGENLIRAELCNEAIRLATLAAAHPATGLPQAHALAALMLFQGARLAARSDDRGNLLLLAEQDRALWNRDMIQRGVAHMDQAAAGDQLTTYHIEAGIAACHANAESFESTDWTTILMFYDLLLERESSPVHALNRAVALSMIEGPAAGLEAVHAIADHPSLKHYYLLPATFAALYDRLGRPGDAQMWYARALDLATSQPVRRFIAAKLDS